MAIHRLKANFIDKVTRAGLYADGGGLYLQVGDGGGAKSWIFRYSRTRFGRTGGATMGLGPAHTISADAAREVARECRLQILQGIDPLEARKADRTAKQLEATKNVTFEFCAEDYIAHKLTTWAPGTARRSKQVIRDYLLPKLGKLPIAAIDHLHAEDVIKPIWEKKTVTAVFARMHLEIILDRAKAKGLRTGDNPASLKGPLGVLLHPVAEIRIVKPHASLPYQEIGAFMATLRAYKPARKHHTFSAANEVLKFTILTAVRVGQAREMHWNEVDWESRLWTCPWQRTKRGKKTKRNHLVPLSEPALAVLKRMKDQQKADGVQSDFVFLHPKPHNQYRLELRLRKGGANLSGRVVTNTGINKFLADAIGRKDITIYGFRSSFSAWANDLNRPREVIEMVLDHVIGNQIERIYARDSERLEQRRKLMDEWAEYCGRTEPLAGDVIPFRQAK